MATALEIITGAVKLLKVKTAESPLEDNEAQDGLVALNDMLNEWNLEDIDIGFETIDDLQDELFLDTGTEGAVKANLAVYIAPEYKTIVSDLLLLRARTSKKAVRGSLSLRPLDFPDTLPLGSGNERNNRVSDGDAGGGTIGRRFYPSNAARKCS